MIPWNRWSSDLSGIPQTDEAVITSIDLYPGVQFCRNYSPHSLWHEESANGLLELVLMADSVNNILGRNNKN
jgi:phosphoribosyl 1,2-cyclic phosphodiesterase